MSYTDAVRIETICTGDELLTGLTADTNSLFFQRQLLEKTGLQVRRSAIVGDVREDIIDALSVAAERADLVLVSGGLGPTADDITVDCAAEAAGVSVIEDPLVLEHLKARYQQRNIPLTENNRRQARRPIDAEAVLNAEGSAPLIIHRRKSCLFFFVPGVPREYRHLVEAQVVPRIRKLQQQQGVTEVRVLRLLKTVGLPESMLDNAVRPLFAKHPQVIFGFRTHAPENHLKLMAVAADDIKARAMLAAAEHDAREVLGRVVFGADEESMPQVVLQLLQARKATVSTAESCTGGMVAAQLTSVAGSSASMLGGAVAYANELKHSMAQVSQETLQAHGAVSAEVASELAQGIRRATGSAWSVSTTGIAGPGGGSEAKPVGTVFMAVSSSHGTVVEKHHFVGDRERIRLFATAAALDLLRRTLEDSPS